MKKQSTLLFAIIAVVTASSALLLSNININVSVKTTDAEAGISSELSPVKAKPNRDAYFPGTEDLDPNEMRVISLGTAMPFQRPAQAAPSFLVELGNGDKFLFDIGTGAAERLAALQIPSIG